MPDLHSLLAETASRHSHLCPRQVLGVRAALAGIAALDLQKSKLRKPLLVIVETDGCFADGIEVATGVSVGHRTLRIEDYGKIATTFVDVKTERAVRIHPRLEVRQLAKNYAPDEKRIYFAQLKAYQVMPLEELLYINDVKLITPIKVIISQAGIRTQCKLCGEEIINEREVHRDGLTLCQACAGQAYYRMV